MRLTATEATIFFALAAATIGWAFTVQSTISSTATSVKYINAEISSLHDDIKTVNTNITTLDDHFKLDPLEIK